MKIIAEISQNMDTQTSEHHRVVSYIRDTIGGQYDVLANLEKEEHYIGTIFPDLIFLVKGTKRPIFIIEVRKNGDIANCIQKWKNAVSIPATLYIIVPETDLSNTISIAQVVGLQMRFGSYKIDKDGTISVKYD